MMDEAELVAMRELVQWGRVWLLILSFLFTMHVCFHRE